MRALNCYRCFDTENLSIKSQNKQTGYKLMVCKDCRAKQARKRIAKQATYEYKPKSDHKKLEELWKQHNKSMERILTKQKAGGYGG